MENEILTCNSCSQKWQRPKSRGRKPVVCPECAPTLVKTSSPSPSKVTQPTSDSSSNSSQMKYPAPSSWQCPSCQVSVKLQVSVDYPPTHNCKKRLNKIYSLEMV